MAKKAKTVEQWERALKATLQAGQLYREQLDTMIGTTARTLVLRDKLFACVETTEPLLREYDGNGNEKHKANPAYADYQRIAKEVRDQLKALGLTINDIAMPDDDIDALNKAVHAARG